MTFAKLRPFICFLFILQSCSKPPSLGASDPVGEFRHLLSSIPNQRFSEHDNPWSEWWKNIEYDVRKTDSLVSPYIATLDVDVFEFSTKEQSDPSSRHHYDVNFAYQDGKWVLKDLSSKFYSYINGEEFGDGKIERHAPGDTYWNKFVYKFNLD